jgi:hypothetical protein
MMMAAVGVLVLVATASAAKLPHIVMHLAVSVVAHLCEHCFPPALPLIFPMLNLSDINTSVHQRGDLILLSSTIIQF